MFSLLTQAPSTAPPSQPSHSSPPSLNTDTPFPQGQRRPHVTPEEIRQFFLDYHHRKKKEESLGISEEQEAVDMGQDNKEGRGREGVSTMSPCVNLCYSTDYTQKQKLPPHHQAAVDVLQRCVPFLSSPSPSLRLTVLDTAEHCITALRTDKVCTRGRELGQGVHQGGGS